MQKLVLIGMCLSLAGCGKIGFSGKWDNSLPDNGSLLCSLKGGEAFYVENGMAGFSLHRAADADKLCQQR